MPASGDPTRTVYYMNTTRTTPTPDFSYLDKLEARARWHIEHPYDVSGHEYDEEFIGTNYSTYHGASAREEFDRRRDEFYAMPRTVLALTELIRQLAPTAPPATNFGDDISHLSAFDGVIRFNQDGLDDLVAERVEAEAPVIATPAPRPDLDAIEQRANAATPGPWEAGFFCDGHHANLDCRDCQLYKENGYPIAELDRKHVTNFVYAPEGGKGQDLKRNGSDECAKFIAAARTDVPALIAYVRHLEDLLDRAVAASQVGEEYVEATTATREELPELVAGLYHAANEYAGEVEHLEAQRAELLPWAVMGAGGDVHISREATILFGKLVHRLDLWDDRREEPAIALLEQIAAGEFGEVT